MGLRIFSEYVFFKAINLLKLFSILFPVYSGYKRTSPVCQPSHLQFSSSSLIFHTIVPPWTCNTGDTLWNFKTDGEMLTFSL
jgi:hypothetical protein